MSQRLREQLPGDAPFATSRSRAARKAHCYSGDKASEEKMQKMMLQCTRPMSPEILLNASSMAEVDDLCSAEHRG